VRLNRYLAMCGVAARRKADELIAAGRVRVNGEVPPPGGVLVTPGQDRVEVDGVAADLAATHVYVMVNKPAGYLSAVSDRTRRPLVTQLVPRGTRQRGLHPVGRLDLRSRGLVILTDDGELSYRLQHPRHHVEKEYVVEIAGKIDPEALERLRTGIPLEEGITAPADVALLRQADERSVLRVVLRQGWKRQLRRSFSAMGRVVVDLRRVRIGTLPLGDLEEGHARPLSPDEVRRLQVAVGLAE
jgi:pseudouridine synthase